jgi:hypothetical protein|tara:strand:+ start:174 stop:443 length:270 start_codon:yes stop_codon:yes gene_type:complete
MNICDKIYVFCACLLAVFVSNLFSDTAKAEELNLEIHDDYCVEWKEHVARDEYIMGLETKVKDFYLFFVTEQKRIAEEAYLKAGVRYEW